MRTGRLMNGFVVAAAVAAAVACGPGQQSPEGPQVTLTGCLQPGESPNTFRLAATGGPSGAVGTTGEDTQTSQRDNPTGTPSGSRSSDVGISTTRVYTLIAGREVDLSPHQGTVVQVTGRLHEGDGATGTGGANDANRGNERSPAEGRSPAQGNPTTGTGSDQSARGTTTDRGAATVHVENVKRMSGLCSDNNR